MLAAWLSLAGERVLMCNGDGRVLVTRDASSGYMLGFRVRVASQGGTQGRCGVSSTTSPRCSAWGSALSWPQGPLPTRTCLCFGAQ